MKPEKLLVKRLKIRKFWIVKPITKIRQSAKLYKRHKKHKNKMEIE